MEENYASFDINTKLILNFWKITHTMHGISKGKGIPMLLYGSMREREFIELLNIQLGRDDAEERRQTRHGFSKEEPWYSLYPKGKKCF